MAKPYICLFGLGMENAIAAVLSIHPITHYSNICCPVIENNFNDFGDSLSGLSTPRRDFYFCAVSQHRTPN